jgi:lysozyme
MTPSNDCATLIRTFEGFRPEAYLCPANKLTIGWGHTGGDFSANSVWNQDRADKVLQADIAHAWGGIRGLVGKCTQGQCDALTDFAFNLGVNALIGSTLLAKHKSGDYKGAQAEFGKWVFAHANGKLVQLPGLVKRRAAEAALYGKVEE